MRAKEKHEQTKNDKEKGTRIAKYTCQKKINSGHSIERVWHPSRDKKSKACTAVGRMCGLSTVVTPAGASLTMYREIRSYANSIRDDNNNNNSASREPSDTHPGSQPCTQMRSTPQSGGKMSKRLDMGS